MAASGLLSGLLLGALLAAAVAWDLRGLRIPNTLVMAVAGAGVAAQVLLPEGAGLFDPARPGGIGAPASIGAGCAMLALGFALWRARLLGAGDAKLLGAAAIWFGPEGAVVLLLASLIAGGLLAAGVSLNRRRASASGTPRVVQPRPTFAYSPAIAAGAAVAALAQARGW